jgi:hypothetical protein
MIKQSTKKESVRIDSPKIRECIALLESGWKIFDYKGIPKSLDLGVIFKNDGKDKEIRLTLSEQKMWIAILEKREELVKNAKSI